MGDDLKYKISIEQTTTGAGAAEAARDLDKLRDAAENAGESQRKVGKEAKSAGEEIASLGSKGNGARELLEGFERAGNGGAGAIFGLAKAFKGLFEIGTSASPFGAILTGIAALIAVGSLVKEKFFSPVEEGMEKTAEKTEAVIEKMTQFEKLQFDGEKKKKELDEITESFERLRAKAEEAYTASQKLTDASTRLKLSQINLDEATQLRAAGGNESAKAEISARAEFARANVTSDAEASKNSERLKADLAEQKSFKDQTDATDKNLAEQKKIQQDASKNIEAEKSSAAAAGVRSDQENALGQLPKLISELEKSNQASAKYQAGEPERQKTREILSASGGGLNAQDLSELNEEGARQQRQNELKSQIKELQSKAPEYQNQIDSGKVTYTETAKTLEEERQKAAKAQKSDGSDENTNVLNAANAKADIAANLAKDLPKYQEQLETASKTAADLAKKSDVLHEALKAKTADVTVDQINATTIQNERGTALNKIGATVNSTNATRSAAAEKSEAASSTAQGKIDDLENRRVQSVDPIERLQLQSQIADAKAALPQKAAVPSPVYIPGLDKALNQRPSAAQPKVDDGPALSGKGKITTADGIDHDLQPIPQKGKGISKDEDGGAAAAIEDGVHAIDDLDKSVAKPVAQDVFSSPLAKVKEAVDKSNEATVSAIQAHTDLAQTMVGNLQNITAQLKAQQTMISNLQQQVSSIS